MGLNVALDGPSGAGKSTIAKALAKKFGFVYVDTGALYRSIGLYVKRRGADTKSPEEVVPLLPDIRVELKYFDGSQRVILNGEDVSDVIRTPEISMAASDVSAIPAVREHLLDLQREIADTNDTVMDGRDIGTVILPNADVKIFMTASAEERAKRRYEELLAKGQDVSYDAILSDINQRDYNDTHRETAPLMKADDAIELDTTSMSIDEVVEKISEYIVAEEKEEEIPFRTIPAFRRYLYAVLRFVVGIPFKLIFNIKYEGNENVPQTGSVIIAGNHITWFDPILIAIKVKYISSYMAKAELFDIPVLGLGIKLVHGFPTRRNSADASALGRAIKYIRNGYNLTIFPEGTRMKGGKIGRAKSGVAYIASKSGVPVYPVGISYKGHLCFRRTIRVRFGKPIMPEELNLRSMSKTELRAAGEKIMSTIAELVK